MHIKDEDPHQIADTLGALDPAKVDGVAIMAPESPQVRDAKARLTQRGIEAAAFLSGQITMADEVFVGIDNHAAGATAGRPRPRQDPGGRRNPAGPRQSGTTPGL